MSEILKKKIIDILHIQAKPLNVYELAFYFEKQDVKELQSKIKNHIDLYGENSIFFHAGNRKYGLREWLCKTNEYNEVLTSAIGKVNPLEEIIAVFENKYLSKYINSEIFTPTNFTSEDFKENIIPLERKLAELNTELIQLVSCFVLRYENTIASFYKTKYQPEKRLNSEKKCVNFGGHIAYKEFFSLFDALDPNSFSPFVIRELLEEVNIATEVYVKQIGLLHDKSTEIGRQHLGLVYEVGLKNRNISIKEQKLFKELKFESIKELNLQLDAFDSWSIEIVKYYANI